MRGWDETPSRALALGVYISHASPAAFGWICSLLLYTSFSFCCRFHSVLEFLLQFLSFVFSAHLHAFSFLLAAGQRRILFTQFDFECTAMRYSLSYSTLLAVAASSTVHATLLQPPGVAARNGKPVSLEPLPENPQITGKPSTTTGTDCRVTENITVTQFVTKASAVAVSTSCDSIVTVTSTSIVYSSSSSSSSSSSKSKTKKAKSSKTTSSTAQQTSSVSVFRAESVVHSIDHTETIVQTATQTVAPLAVTTGGTVTAPQDGDEGVSSPPKGGSGGDDGGSGGGDDDDDGGDDDAPPDDKPTGRPAESTTIFTSIVPKPAPTDTLVPFPAANGNSTNPNASGSTGGFPQPTVPVAAAGIMGSTPSVGAAVALAAGVLAILF